MKMNITEKDIPVILSTLAVLGGLSAGGYYGYKYYTSKEELDELSGEERSSKEADLDTYKKYGLGAAGVAVVGLIAVYIFRAKQKGEKKGSSDDECELSPSAVCEVQDDDSGDESDDDYNKTKILTF